MRLKAPCALVFASLSPPPLFSPLLACGSAGKTGVLSTAGMGREDVTVGKAGKDSVLSTGNFPLPLPIRCLETTSHTCPSYTYTHANIHLCGCSFLICEFASGLTLLISKSGLLALPWPHRCATWGKVCVHHGHTRLLVAALRL